MVASYLVYNIVLVQDVTMALHLGLLYLGSLVVLLVYSILYGLTAKESRWLGAVTSGAVIVLDWNMGVCLFGFELLKSRVAALFVAGTSRVFLISFGVHYWYLGHCISYAVVASVLLGAAVTRYLSVTNPLAARRDALQSTVIRLREGFRRKGQNSSSSSSEGCGSSMKRSSSAEAGHLGNGIEAICKSAAHGTGEVSSHEGINSDKSIDSGRPSFVFRSSSCRSIVQETELGAVLADKHIDTSSSFLVSCSGSLETQGPESGIYQQSLDSNLAQVFQESLNNPRVTSMLKRKTRHGDLELTNLLEDKGLDPNFAVMLKEKGLDPTILALLQRGSLDADRDHRDNTDAAIIVDSNSSENVMPNQISLSEELRRRGLETWLEISRTVLHRIAGTPERAWVLFFFIFVVETVVVAVFRPKTIVVMNGTHQQFEFGCSVLLLSPVVCSIMAFLRSLQSEEMSMTSRPRKGFRRFRLLLVEDELIPTHPDDVHGSAEIAIKGSRDAILDGFPKEELDAEGNWHFPNVIPRRPLRRILAETMVFPVLFQNGELMCRSDRKNAIMLLCSSEDVLRRVSTKGDGSNDVGNVFVKHGVDQMRLPSAAGRPDESKPSGLEEVLGFPALNSSRDAGNDVLEVEALRPVKGKGRAKVFFARRVFFDMEEVMDELVVPVRTILAEQDARFAKDNRPVVRTYDRQVADRGVRKSGAPGDGNDGSVKALLDQIRTPPLIRPSEGDPRVPQVANDNPRDGDRASQVSNGSPVGTPVRGLGLDKRINTIWRGGEDGKVNLVGPCKPESTSKLMRGVNRERVSHAQGIEFSESVRVRGFGFRKKNNVRVEVVIMNKEFSKGRLFSRRGQSLTTEGRCRARFRGLDIWGSCVIGQMSACCGGSLESVPGFVKHVT
ncbi:hypothetical protein GIB67_019665 [Kingdonia uniflora]|uniref:Calpain-type cysteine protease DEK1 n=1 Tax=Kingdonia uniflora TaxID=39325 RepID=A0A7J7MJR3_9MAGN|nr:hypothetical protein GIB67_019665 [Kingdonia uniflora]